jgi:NADPH:quinone reductase-like Zn-dependent oxidoreductase
MKAVVYHRYGSPDVFEYVDIPKPIPADHQVLVKIHATATNPWDWRHLRAKPFLIRLENGFRRPQHIILGADIAGRVEAVGKNVTQFKPGDAVFGEVGYGGFAEYVCVSEKNLVLKPDTISFEEAAAVPMCGLTALLGLRDKCQIKPGQKVLINGASGGIGTYAVQMAKFYGAEVTGVCSTTNLELVRSIGADHVIDYTRENFSRKGEQYDVIYDTIGNLSVARCRRALRPGGICMVAGFTNFARLIEVVAVGKWITRRGHKTIGHTGTPKITQKDLLTLKDMLESRAMKSVIDRCYSLAETAEAIRYLEKKHARGKVIIVMDAASQA